MEKVHRPRSRKQAAGAIKACLDLLAEEARDANLPELCQLIRLAALAADDAIDDRAEALQCAAANGAAAPGPQ